MKASPTRRPSRRRWRSTSSIRRSPHRGACNAAHATATRRARHPRADPHRNDRQKMSASHVTIPDIGDFHDIPVIEVLVKPGDTVAVDDSLVTLESDKATMDVPSPAAGTVQAVLVKPGDKVSAGTAVLTLEAAAAAPRSAPMTGTASKAPTAEIETPSPRGEKGRADAAGEGASATPPAGQTIEVRVPHI